MRVLVGCEFSGIVRDAFIARGHHAVSCDLLPTERPGPHRQEDIFGGILHEGWDLGIFHWPCTYLCNSGVKHLYVGGQAANGPDFGRWALMVEHAEAFKRLLSENPIPKIALENPVMSGSAMAVVGIPPTQIIQPWQFGHREMKATCLWLKNLPLLVPTDIVGPPPRDPEARKAWARVHRESPGPDRWKNRSRTFTGIAAAMAEQWG